MKKILTYCSLILALNLSAGEGEVVPTEAPLNTEKKTEVKSGYKITSLRGERATSTTSTSSTRSVRSQMPTRTLNRLNLRRPTTSVTSRAGSVGGASNTTTTSSL